MLRYKYKKIGTDYVCMLKAINYWQKNKDDWNNHICELEDST